MIHTIKKFKIDTYSDREIIVIIVDNCSEGHKYISQKYKYTDTETFDNYDAVSIMHKTRSYLIFRFKDLSHSIIAHECMHAAYDILDLVGIPLRAENSEAITYLLETIIRKTLKVLNLKDKLNDQEFK
jgi:hypothetical protein